MLSQTFNVSCSSFAAKSLRAMEIRGDIFRIFMKNENELLLNYCFLRRIRKKLKAESILISYFA